MVALRDLIGQEWAAVSACGAGVQQPCNLTETYLFICTARMGLVILFQAAHRVCSRNQITHTKNILLHSSYTSPHLVLKTAASCDREGWLLFVVGTTVDSAASPKANVINLKHFATFIVSFFFFFCFSF